MADSGVIPAQTLFIDDGQKNVDTAQAWDSRFTCPPRERISDTCSTK